MLKKIFSKTLIHGILIGTSLLSIFPFIWLTSTSLKGLSEDIFAYPPTIIPTDFTWANYIDVWHKVDFIAYFMNSMIVAALTVILNLVLSSLAAYPLARMQFKGNKFFSSFHISYNYDTVSGDNATGLYYYAEASFD